MNLKTMHSPSIWLNIDYWVEYYCISYICVTNYILCHLLEVLESGTLCEGVRRGPTLKTFLFLKLGLMMAA